MSACSQRLAAVDLYGHTVQAPPVLLVLLLLLSTCYTTTANTQSQQTVAVDGGGNTGDDSGGAVWSSLAPALASPVSSMVASFGSWLGGVSQSFLNEALAGAQDRVSLTDVSSKLKQLVPKYETAPNMLISEKESHNVYHYPSSKWVCYRRPVVVNPVESETVQWNRTKHMFNRVFSYFSGQNSLRAKLPMTLPMVNKFDAFSQHPTYTLCFFIPRDHQQSPPTPLDPQLKITTWPDKYFISQRFDGLVLYRSGWDKAAFNLERISNKEQLEGIDFSSYYSVYYDPPVKFWNRHNEKSLRRSVGERVAALSASERRRQSHCVTRQLLQMPEYQASQHIGLYVSMHDELCTDLMIQAVLSSGRTCYIPRYDADSTFMDMVRLHSWHHLADLAVTKWCVRQPCWRQAGVAPAQLDMLVVPGRAFSKLPASCVENGQRPVMRLGRGRAYYDGFLRSFTATTVGVAFTEQVVSHVPHDEHDVALHALLQPLVA